MDWAKISETIIANGTVAIVVGWGGILIWRWQQRHKRRFEIAEQVRIAFSKAERALHDIRFRDEEVPHSSSLSPDPEIALARAMIERAREQVEKSNKLFDELDESKVTCSIHLGKDATDAIITLQAIHFRVGQAAYQLSQMLWSSKKSIDHEEQAKKLERVVYSNARIGKIADDDVTLRIRAAAEKLKAVCDRYHSELW